MRTVPRPVGNHFGSWAFCPKYLLVALLEKSRGLTVATEGYIMISTPNESRDRRAAVLCSHVASDHHQILRAVRDEPAMAADSGWQFLCGANDHAHDTAKVWAVFEVLNYEPTLVKFIDSPPGTVLSRVAPGAAWHVGSR